LHQIFDPTVVLGVSQCMSRHFEMFFIY